MGQQMKTVLAYYYPSSIPKPGPAVSDPDTATAATTAATTVATSSATSTEAEAEPEPMDEKLANAIQLVQNHSNVTVFTSQLVAAIQYIWHNDDKVGNVFREDVAGNVNIITLDPTTEQFWNSLDRIKKEDYVP